MKQILTLLLLCGALCSRAQTAPEPAPESAPAPTVESLAAQVEVLEKKTTTWDKVLARLPRISGYAQVGYEWSDDASTFFVRSVRLILDGDLGRKLDYRVQVEFCSPKLVDAYIQYKPFTQLNLLLGEYKLPFSIENTEYPPTRVELIECPMALRFLMGFNDICGIAATGRDMGLTAWGGFIKRDGYSIINYDLGVFNGEGINVRDANKSKDVVGRLRIKPVTGLTLSGSYYWGEYGSDYRKRIRYSGGVCYDRGPVVVRSEYIGGVTGLSVDNGPVVDIDSEGWYAVAGWRVTRSLMPVVRYDTFVRDCAQKSSTRQTNYTAGLTWQPLKYLRCQLNYTYEDFNAPSVDSRNVVAVMFTGMF